MTSKDASTAIQYFLKTKKKYIQKNFSEISSGVDVFYGDPSMEEQINNAISESGLKNYCKTFFWSKTAGIPVCFQTGKLLTKPEIVFSKNLGEFNYNCQMSEMFVNILLKASDYVQNLSKFKTNKKIVNHPFVPFISAGFVAFSYIDSYMLAYRLTDSIYMFKEGPMIGSMIYVDDSYGLNTILIQNDKEDIARIECLSVPIMQTAASVIDLDSCRNFVDLTSNTITIKYTI